MADPSNELLRVFISYSRREMASADKLVAALEVAGFAVTIDRRDLPYSEEWQSELADLIRSCDTVIWLVSQNSLKSRWCSWELGEVLRLNKRLVPVALEVVGPESIPESLGRIQMLPAEGFYEAKKHFQMLVAALNTDSGWLKEHTRLSDHARQWLNKGKAPTLVLRGIGLKGAQSWADGKPKGAPSPSEEILELLLASRRTQGRRQRLGIAAALLIALVGFGLAGGAFWQRELAVAQTQAAEEQRKLAEQSEAKAVEQQKLAEERAVAVQVARDAAERNFDTAKETVNGLVFDISEGLRDVEGMRIATIQKVLTGVQTAVDELYKKSPDDIGLQRMRAAMLTNFGETYLAAGGAAEALAANEEALKINIVG